MTLQIVFYRDQSPHSLLLKAIYTNTATINRNNECLHKLTFIYFMSPWKLNAKDIKILMSVATKKMVLSCVGMCHGHF